MREFVYFSSQARTSGNFNEKELMQAGRMDIVCHVVIQAFFLSQKLRQDTKLHLVFYGPPDPPKHLELWPKKVIPGTGKEFGSIDISKKDVSGLIKRMLFKYRQGRKTEVFPGYWIEKKSLLKVIDELRQEGKEIYILDDRGKDIREINISSNPVFVLGDHHGLPVKELKRLKKECVLVSIGKQTYLASQVVAIVNNELDRRGL